jgi:hypothetical protein
MGIIRTLAKNCPTYADHLMNIHDNFIDLATPFQKGDYWMPKLVVQLVYGSNL